MTYQCADCKRASDRQWRARNAEKLRADKRAYGQTNRDKHREWERAYRMRDAERVRAIKRAWAKRNPHKIRLHGLLIRYGLDEAAYMALWEAQHGRCALCECELTTGRYGRTATHVDHDHITGKVRSLLCRVCNVLLGTVGESPELLRKMADYLERHR